jgi:hypothetical protein
MVEHMLGDLRKAGLQVTEAGANGKLISIEQ